MPTNVHWFRHWSLKEADGQNLTAMSTESKYANNCKSTKDSTTNTSWDWLHLEFVHWIFHHSSMPQSKWKTMFLFAKSVGVGELKWQSFASIRLCPWLHQIGSVVINWSVPHPAAKYTLYKKKRRNVSKQRTLLHSLKRLTLVMLEKRQRDFIVRTKICKFLKTESVGRTSRISSKPAYMLLRIHPLTLEYIARNKCSGMLRENKSCRWLPQVLAMSARPFPLLDLGSMQKYEVFGRFRKSEQKISWCFSTS